MALQKKFFFIVGNEPSNVDATLFWQFSFSFLLSKPGNSKLDSLLVML